MLLLTDYFHLVLILVLVTTYVPTYRLCESHFQLSINEISWTINLSLSPGFGVRHTKLRNRILLLLLHNSTGDPDYLLRGGVKIKERETEYISAFRYFPPNTFSNIFDPSSNCLPAKLSTNLEA